MYTCTWTRASKPYTLNHCICRETQKKIIPFECIRFNRARRPYRGEIIKTSDRRTMEIIRKMIIVALNEGVHVNCNGQWAKFVNIRNYNPQKKHRLKTKSEWKRIGWIPRADVFANRARSRYLKLNESPTVSSGFVRNRRVSFIASKTQKTEKKKTKYNRHRSTFYNKSNLRVGRGRTCARVKYL